MREEELAARAAEYVRAAGGQAWEEALLTAARRALWEVKNACALPQLPEGLWEEAAALAAGLCLQAASPAGEAAPLSVREGDTQVPFSGEDLPGPKRAALAAELCAGARRAFARYRRLVW